MTPTAQDAASGRSRDTTGPDARRQRRPVRALLLAIIVVVVGALALVLTGIIKTGPRMMSTVEAEYCRIARWKLSSSLGTKYSDLRVAVNVRPNIPSLDPNELDTLEAAELYRTQWEIETNARCLMEQDHLSVVRSRREDTARQGIIPTYYHVMTNL